MGKCVGDEGPVIEQNEIRKMLGKENEQSRAFLKSYILESAYRGLDIF